MIDFTKAKRKGHLLRKPLKLATGIWNMPIPYIPDPLSAEFIMGQSNRCVSCKEYFEHPVWRCPECEKDEANKPCSVPFQSVEERN